ncbi:MAG: hypothetical protein SGPRY_002906 [Prymnesium sp.]
MPGHSARTLSSKVATSHEGHSSSTNRENNKISRALLDATRISGASFSANKILWVGYQFFGEREERMYGTFEKWINAASRQSILAIEERFRTTS